jgi:2'-5' RNA ligase
MRLFIACVIPENIQAILKTTQEKIKFPGKATKTTDFHLTLKFLGETEESKLQSITDSLSKINFTPFNIELSDVGTFPDRNNARVIWAGLEPHQDINDLQKQIDDATIPLGFRMDNVFHPHLTLARIKSIDNRNEFLKMIDSLKLEKAEFKISSFNLIKSTLTAQGPVYENLYIFH